MRVLVGHTNQMPQLRLHRPLPGRETKRDDILAFGNGYTQVMHEPGMKWTELLARCPQGWRPDVYIHWSPEYNALPDGLEDADCLMVGVWGDWNLGGQAMRAIADIFDVQFADRNGGTVLRQMGFDNVCYSPLWAFDPILHRRLPNVNRDIDVLMIGNFNHGIQSERARWLARVARLSARHNVVLTAGVYGDDYVRLMNRAKIVFNRSIRGEINMRAYEAPACGALLFYEAENREIGDLYVDREECVLYDDATLESLLDYYLAQENASERERIAEAGWRQVQTHDNAHHFADLLDQVEARLTDATRLRRFTQSEPKIREERRATQWLLSSNRQVLARLLPASNNAKGGRDKSPPYQDFSLPVCADVGARFIAPAPQSAPASNVGHVILGELSRFPEAIAIAEQELRDSPDHVLTRCNLAFLHLANGDVPSGMVTLEDAAKRLTDPNLQNGQIVGLMFPRRYDAFLAGVERVWAAYAPDSEEWREQMRGLLLGRISLTLADLYFADGRYREAANAAETAVEAWPESGEANLIQARALRAWGRADDATDAYRQTIAIAPFQHDAWNELARLLLDLQRPGETVALLNEWATILRACPIYDALRPRCEAMRREALALARQPSALPVPITRLLAFPDWRDPQDWQPLVAAFANRYAPTNSILLMLRADPKTTPDGQKLLASLSHFLTQNLRFSPSALPNITLLNQPLAPDEEWKLFHVADALLTVSPLSDTLADFASAACLPIWKTDDLIAHRESFTESSYAAAHR